MSKRPKQAPHLVLGAVVQYVLDGQVVFGGICEYVTADGWVGIRCGRRIDEAPAARVEIDPT